MDLNYFSTLNNKYITLWQSNLMMDNPNFWRLPTIINSFFAVVSLVQFSAAVCHQRRCLDCDLNAVMISLVAMNQATSGRIGRRIWENSTCRNGVNSAFVLGRFINCHGSLLLVCFSHLFGKIGASIAGAGTPREGFLHALTTNLMKMNPNKHVKKIHVVIVKYPPKTKKHVP